MSTLGERLAGVPARQGEKVPLRRRGNKLERWEIALIKAMVTDGALA